MSCNVAPNFTFLCDAQAAWGIIMETLAAAGAIFTIMLMLALVVMVPRICDSAKRALVPIQLIFLLGTLGIFGLTFAFIIQLNSQTCPTRFFLFGVLFAICFSCLLVHASKLVRLVRGGLGMSWWVMLATVIVLSLVQIIIAILYVAIYLTRNASNCEGNSKHNTDFVLILIYVFVLMAITFTVSIFSLCGPFSYWKRHGLHIYITIFISMGIWVAWIVMLLNGNITLGNPQTWDDPVRAIALVANGWVFLILYIVPELCLLTRCQPNHSKDVSQDQPRLLRQTVGVDNQVFAQEDSNLGSNSGRSSPYSPPRFDATLALRDMESPKEFTIPRPQQCQNSFMHYRSHDLSDM
ncbi:G-protein coupled receptor family C group 5 member D [Spea bombifrons]|uniref:G-protein coupled receptor family C group 5 member D n=1 Tax=Spea bombifrons TaxID=233779 RepID=UPI00234953FA|nr:G-protein coupled receptor family C group 5 member D [Spea bombifrons]